MNGFGYGGTNGHLILEAVEDYMASASWLESSSAKLLDKDIGGESCPTEQKDNSQLITSNLGAENKRLFVLSHANEDGLSRSASDLVKYVEMKASNFGGINEAEFLNNLAYTLSKRRTRHEIRGAVSAASATELVRSLRDIISESIEPNKRPRHAFENPNICFVFNGKLINLKNCNQLSRFKVKGLNGLVWGTSWPHIQYLPRLWPSLKPF